MICLLEKLSESYRILAFFEKICYNVATLLKRGKTMKCYLDEKDFRGRELYITDVIKDKPSGDDKQNDSTFTVRYANGDFDRKVLNTKGNREILNNIAYARNIGNALLLVIQLLLLLILLYI